MHLSVLIGRSGTTFAWGLTAADSEPVWFTPGAAKAIRAMMKEKGAMCKVCSTIARSDELDDDGKCKTGVGCATDIDIAQHPDRLTSATMEGAMLRTELANDLWGAFVNTVKAASEAPELPPDEGGNAW